MNFGSIANHRITIDNNRRISVSGNGISNSFCYNNTTFCFITCRNLDDIICRIQIESSRWEHEMITWNSNQFKSIDEPTVSTGDRVSTEIHFSVCSILYSVSNLTTDANSWIASNEFNSFHSVSSRENINNCISPSFAFTVNLFNSYIISGSIINSNCQYSASTDSDCISITIIRFSIIPLIYQVRHIVVSEVSGQGNIFTFANNRSTYFNSNGRINTDENAINITDNFTSSTFINNNSYFIRIISLRQNCWESIGVLIYWINTVNSP